MCFVLSAQPPASGPGAPIPPQSTATTPPQAGSGAGGDSLSPELFTGIVQGVLSTMMSSLGAQQGSGESIAQFIQRLSQSSNLFTPGSGDAVGESTGCSHEAFIQLRKEKHCTECMYSTYLLLSAAHWLPLYKSALV